MSLLRTEQELLSEPMPKQLVDGLLLENSLAMLFSAPGVGKSFLALDLALSIASGQEQFIGLPLRASGPVVYVIGEGGGRFKLRLMAWKQKHKIIDPLPFHWTKGPIDLLDGDEVKTFITEMKALGPKLIVIDTLSRCIAGHDENNQQYMSSAIENCEDMRLATGATVMLLHHVNATGERERGSTVFKGAIDTQLRLAPRGKTKGALKLVTSKQKDLEEADDIALLRSIIPVEGEFEEGGEQCTSCVLEPVEQPKLTARQKDILKVIEGSEKELSKTQVVEQVKGNKQDNLDALSGLVELGFLSIREQGQTHWVQRTVESMEMV